MGANAFSRPHDGIPAGHRKATREEFRTGRGTKDAVGGGRPDAGQLVARAGRVPRPRPRTHLPRLRRAPVRPRHSRARGEGVEVQPGHARSLQGPLGALRPRRGPAVEPGHPPRGREPGQGRRRGHEGHRGRQPRAQGRAAPRLPADGAVGAHRAVPAVRPAPTPALRRRLRADLRGLPVELRHGRGSTRRRVLHAVLDRPAHRRDHRAVPGAGVRPGVRVGRHVRPVRQVRRAPQRVGRPRSSRSTARSRRRSPSRSPR